MLRKIKYFTFERREMKSKLFESRRFWIMILAIVSELAMHYFGGVDTDFLLKTFTPLAMLLIMSYTVDGTVWARKE
jgi:hypothetical protein